MSTRDVSCLLVVFAASVLLPRSSAADDTHYNDFPIGGRAVGLGGAFVALANDPSGIYYNPAGIVDAARTTMQVSSNLYGIEISKGIFATEGAPDLETVFADVNVIPTSAAFTGSIGSIDEKKRAKTGYGLGVFVPSFRSLNVQTLSDIPSDGRLVGCDRLSYQRSLLDRTFYLGTALAHRIDPTWSVGIGGFLVYRSLRDREATSCFSGASAGESGFTSAETSLEVGVVSAILSLGVKAALAKGLFLGVTVSSPSIGLIDRADVQVERMLSDPSTGTSHLFIEDLRGIGAESKVPTTVRAGIAKIFERLATVTFDVVAHAPTRYRLIELPADRPEIGHAFTTVTEIERRFVLNLNAGAEWLVNPAFSIAAGMFSNFASSPEIPRVDGEQFSEDRLPHVDGFGGSLVLGFFNEYALTRAGLMISHGAGTDLAPRYAGLASLDRGAEFLESDFSQTFIFFFLSTTLRFDERPIEAHEDAPTSEDPARVATR